MAFRARGGGLGVALVLCCLWCSALSSSDASEKSQPSNSGEKSARAPEASNQRDFHEDGEDWDLLKTVASARADEWNQPEDGAEVVGNGDEGGVDNNGDTSDGSTDEDEGPREAEYSVRDYSTGREDHPVDMEDFTLPGGVNPEKKKKKKKKPSHGKRHKKVRDNYNGSDSDNNYDDDNSNRQGLIQKRNLVADMVGFFTGARFRIGNFFLVGETELEVKEMTLKQLSLPEARFNVKNQEMNIGFGEPFPVAPTPSLEERITMPGQVVDGRTILYSASMLNSIPFKVYIPTPDQITRLDLPMPYAQPADQLFIVDDHQWAQVVHQSNEHGDCLGKSDDDDHITIDHEVVCLPLVLGYMEGVVMLKPKPFHHENDVHVMEFQMNQVRPERNYVALLCSSGASSLFRTCLSARPFRISWLGHPGPERSGKEATMESQDGFAKQLSVQMTVTMKIHTLADKETQIAENFPVATSIPLISGREFNVNIGFEATSGVAMRLKGKSDGLNGLSVRRLTKQCQRKSDRDEDIELPLKYHECVYRRFLILATTVYSDDNPWVRNMKISNEQRKMLLNMQSTVWKRVTRYMRPLESSAIVEVLTVGCDSNLDFSMLGAFRRYMKERRLPSVLVDTEIASMYYTGILHYMGYMVRLQPGDHTEVLDIMDDLRLDMGVMATLRKSIPRKQIRALLQTALTKLHQLRVKMEKANNPNIENIENVASEALEVESLIYKKTISDYAKIMRRVRLTFLGARERDARLVPQMNPDVGFVNPELLYELYTLMKKGDCYEVQTHGYGCDREASPCKWVENESPEKDGVHGTIIRGTALKEGGDDIIVLDLAGLPEGISSYILSFVKPERWIAKLRKMIDVEGLLNVVQNSEYYQNYLIDLANYAGNHDEFEFTSSMSLENLALSNLEQSSLPLTRDMLRKKLTKYMALKKGLHVVFHPHVVTEAEVRFSPPPELPTPFLALTIPENRIHLYGRKVIKRVVYCKNAASCDYIYAMVRRKPVVWDKGIGAMFYAGPTSLRLYEYTDELKNTLLQTTDDYQVQEMVAEVGSTVLPLPVLIPPNIPEVDRRLRPLQLKEDSDSSLHLYQMKRLPYTKEGKKYLLAHCYTPYRGNFRCYDVRVWVMKAAMSTDERETRDAKRRLMARNMYAQQIATRKFSQAFLYRCEDDPCEGGGIEDRIKSDHGVFLPFRFSKGLIDDFTVENLSISNVEITVAPTSHFGVDVLMEGIVLKVVFNIYPNAFTKVGLGDLPVLIDMGFEFDYKVGLHPTLATNRNPIVSEVSFLKNGVKIDGAHISSFTIRSSKLEGLLRAGAASKIESIKEKIAFLLSHQKLDQALMADKVQPALNEMAWWMLSNHRKKAEFDVMDPTTKPTITMNANMSLKNVYLTRDQRREAPSVVYQLHRAMSKVVETEPDIFLEQIAGIAPPDMMLLWGTVHGPLLQGIPQTIVPTVTRVYMHCSSEGRSEDKWTRSDKKPRAFTTGPSVHSRYKVPASQFAYIFEKRSEVEKCSIVFEVKARTGGLVNEKWEPFARARLKLKSFARTFLKKGFAAAPMKDQVILYDLDDHPLCSVDSGNCKAQLSFSLGIRWMNRDAASRIMNTVNEGICVDRWDEVDVPLVTSYTEKGSEQRGFTIAGKRSDWCVSLCQGVFPDVTSTVFKKCSFTCMRTAENLRVKDERFCQVFCHQQFPITISKCEKACIGKVITKKSVYGNIQSDWSDTDARSSAMDSDSSSTSGRLSPIRAIGHDHADEPAVVVRRKDRKFRVQDKLDSLERRRIDDNSYEGDIEVDPKVLPHIDDFDDM